MEPRQEARVNMHWFSNSVILTGMGYTSGVMEAPMKANGRMTGSTEEVLGTGKTESGTTANGEMMFKMGKVQ